MINIVFSTTRQWNPGDEFILYGIRNILDKMEIVYNPIIYNRHPDVRQNACTQTNYYKNMTKSHNNHYIKEGICDNSIKGWQSWNQIQLVIIAGTPEWESLRCDELYRLTIKYKIPIAFVGVDYDKNYKITHILQHILKEAIFFSTRKKSIINDIKKLVNNAIAIPCPALLASKKECHINKVKNIAFIYQGNKNNITELAGIEPVVYFHQIEIFKSIIKKYKEFNFSFICHYSDEVLEIEREFDTKNIYYSYDSKDYEDIYTKFDLVIGCRVHGIGLAASLAIPAIPILHDFRGDTIYGFIDEQYIKPINYLDSFENIYVIFENCINNIIKINRHLLDHKNNVLKQYVNLFKSKIIPNIGKEIDYKYNITLPNEKIDLHYYDECIYKKQVCNCIKSLIEEINKLLYNKKIIIKGAGTHTYKLIKILNTSTRVIGIIDKEGNNIEGYNCINIYELEKYEYDYILISSWLYEKDMVNEILMYVSPDKVISIYEILEKKGLYLENDIFNYIDKGVK